jgi:hypothetical protein
MTKVAAATVHTDGKPLGTRYRVAFHPNGSASIRSDRDGVTSVTSRTDAL